LGLPKSNMNCGLVLKPASHGFLYDSCHSTSPKRELQAIN
jgi:hypothetical protein